MRLFGRIAAVLILLLLAIPAIALVGLPRVVASPQFREAVAELLRAEIDRPVEFEGLSLEYFPVRVVVTGVHVDGAAADDPALIRVQSVELGIAQWALLAREVRITDAVVTELVVVVVRDADGVLLPGLAAASQGTAGEDNAEEATVEAAGRDEDASGGGPLPEVRREDGEIVTEADGDAVRLAILSGELVGGRIVLIDRTFDPPVTHVLDSLHATFEQPEASLSRAFEASALYGDQGRVRASGQLARAASQIVLDLEDMPLEVLAPFVPSLKVLTGRVSGRLDVGVLDGELRQLDADLAARELRIGASWLSLSGEADVRGQLAVDPMVVDVTLRAEDSSLPRLTFSGPVEVAARIPLEASSDGVDFVLDLTQTTLDAGGVFHKPADEVARASGRLVLEPATKVAIDTLELRNLTGTGEIDLSHGVAMRLDAPAFDLTGWGTLLPAIEPNQVAGRVALLDASLALEPFQLGGSILLEQLSGLLLHTGKRIEVSGRIDGEGDGLQLTGGIVDLGGERVALAGAMADLLGAQSFVASFESIGVLRTEAVLETLTRGPNILHGPMVLQGEVSGLASPGPEPGAFTYALDGQAMLAIGRGASDGEEGGRLEGVSVLRLVMGELGMLGDLLRSVSGDAFEGSLTESFERLDLQFSAQDGELETEDLRLVYKDYAVSLLGTMQLFDRSLDMTGELELGNRFTGASGGDSDRGVVIPLAHVRGTLEAPTFSVSSKVIAALTTELLLPDGTLRRLTRGLSRQLQRILPPAPPPSRLREGLGDLLKRGEES